MKLHNRGAIITGASQGLGLSIATHFIREGASVLLCARDGNALKGVQRELAAVASPSQRVLVQTADVANILDIEALVHECEQQLPTLDIVVNNAGVHGPISPLESADWEQWVYAISVNLMGAAGMARAVLPHFKRQRRGKIINVSGGGATKPMPGMSAYAASKAALVRLTETLAEEVRPFGIDVNAIAPGAMNTRLLQEVLVASPDHVGHAYHKDVKRIVESGGTPLDKAAALAVYLASEESNGITGKLISAVWDPWREFSHHRTDLTSDVYTLRRIVPKDRGLSWGE